MTPFATLCFLAGCLWAAVVVRAYRVEVARAVAHYLRLCDCAHGWRGCDRVGAHR